MTEIINGTRFGGGHFAKCYIEHYNEIYGKGRSGNRASRFFYPEGRTYSPPRRRKVRSSPFPPCGENYDHSLAPPLPTKSPILRGPHYSGGIAYGNRALSEGDAAPAGAYGQCHISGSMLSLSTQSAVVSASETTTNCLRKPATGSFIADMGNFTPPIFFLRKRNKNRGRKDGENEWRSTTWKRKL